MYFSHNKFHKDYPGSDASVNTVWTGDADLHLYITTVQDG